MDVTHILDGLNDVQRQAVTARPGSYLILAGAGSGKTRVLTHRIAWLIQTENVAPSSILSVTFTNKAAAEMRSRIESLLSMPLSGMWVGTFHGIAHRLLRAHWQQAKLPQNFQILDANDQLRLVKRTIKNLHLDEKYWPARQAAWYINTQKDAGLRSCHIEHYDDLYVKTHLEIYQAYEAASNKGGMVDFGDLLLRAHELLLENPALLTHYQRRFSHILVDEFQDTNSIQYAWIRVLAGDRDNILVVGDDDQSIYGWRGAKIENIHKFSQDFPNSDLIRLAQNYRSSGIILKAANSLISKNIDRLGKELWTDKGDGESIYLYAAFNEIDEARYIVSRIADWATQGNSYREAAILYRSNAQSRVLEEALLRAHIPYRIYGGQRFFERAEIRNVLAYMHLLRHRDADAAFERIINIPPRGMGDKALAVVREIAHTRGQSMWQATQAGAASADVNGRTRNAMQKFLRLIDALDENTADSDLPSLVAAVIANTGLQAYYQRDASEKGQTRLENLQELLSAARSFEPDPDLAASEAPMGLLDEFLSQAALEAGDRQADQDAVQMMTLHSAKGLEFPLVFLAGLEEGLFPHRMSMEEPGRLEEERRLCYVGITRAMQQLYITHAESRRINGAETYNHMSRFVGEIPKGLIQEVRSRAQAVKPDGSTGLGRIAEATSLRLGQRIKHGRFGEGTITNYEGDGKRARVQVNFDTEGSKWLMLSYAKLAPL